MQNARNRSHTSHSVSQSQDLSHQELLELAERKQAEKQIREKLGLPPPEKSDQSSAKKNLNTKQKHMKTAKGQQIKFFDDSISFHSKVRSIVRFNQSKI